MHIYIYRVQYVYIEPATQPITEWQILILKVSSVMMSYTIFRSVSICENFSSRTTDWYLKYTTIFRSVSICENYYIS